ncbi:hypothetical protein DFH11DRAFT_1712013 [Phellopilus nigrolimitatus]|nr:hypothetical protein DFH11DRAFT_1712013 [Phellopilus nigrolimitatus]
MDEFVWRLGSSSIMPDNRQTQAQNKYANKDERKQLKRTIAEQGEEIRSLRAALKAYLDSSADESSYPAPKRRRTCDISKPEDDEPDEPDEGDEGDEDRPDAIWDPDDSVHRCLECSWEIEDSMCLNCGIEYPIPEDDEDETLYDSIVTDHEALNPDRRLAPRGCTPTLDIGRIREIDIPAAYRKRKDEYTALLARGATRMMCETFRLDFSEETGIVAWADHNVFEAFSGPAMKQGDHWKIFLGRCVELEGDDLDGAQFVEDLLEEVLMYPLLALDLDSPEEKWETVEESPGIWSTRPVVERETDAETQISTSDSEDMDDAYMKREDNALDEEYEEQLYNGPVIRLEEYESDTDPAGDQGLQGSDEEMEYAPGLNWPKNGVDATWTSDTSSDSEHQSQGSAENPEITIEQGSHQEQVQAGSTATVGDAWVEITDNNTTNNTALASEKDEDDGDDDMSSVDSDFDDDEVLSGDEAAAKEMKLMHW